MINYLSFLLWVNVFTSPLLFQGTFAGEKSGFTWSWFRYGFSRKPYQDVIHYLLALKGSDGALGIQADSL